jgi:serine/threonine-protein kinase
MADFGGRYRLGKLLGAGGMGEVWLAYDEDLGDRPVAIKVMRPGLLAEPEDVARFQREMRLAARMQHANIMTVYTTGANDRVPFMVLEYLEGRDLSRAVARDAGKPPAVLGPKRVARIGRDTCAALAYAHGLGVVHRDIKPGNLFLCDSGLVKVTDFGIAKAASGTRLTATGILVGTVPYMAPEQWLGEPASFANDVWALGCVLYELLSGALPRSFATPSEYVAAAARGEQVAPLPISGDIPSWLSGVIMAMLQPDPRDRPAAADCRALLIGPAVRSPGADTARPGRRDAAASGVGSHTATSLSADAKGRPSRQPDEPQAAHATTETVGVPEPAAKEDRHLLWALIPLISLGLLMPFPFAESAARRHSVRLWLLAFPYVSTWLALLLVIIIQGSVGHLKPSLAAAIWLLALSVIAALNALWLRHRVFRS